MILIIEDFFTPHEKICKFLFLKREFSEIIKIDQDCYENLYKIQDNDVNFFIKQENFSVSDILKLEYYFEQIYRVDGDLLRFLNKKKRTKKLFHIKRDNSGITAIQEILENFNEEISEINLGKTNKPYMDAQEDDVVLYPSDEE
ncbi:hypothetical protein M153_3930001512 [Pseudoloma neurophilia]|uniref:Uncharacterized protein n=1 Tax=Pseudoloma neurophilia TaxID=146866 RepID=A0A0R0M1R2_9MICR|nr:hypothetical protein M153_3930001512 [Pseudoloma neurophilia]